VVADLDAALRGGGAMGRHAVIRDPTGAVAALWQPPQVA